MSAKKPNDGGPAFPVDFANHGAHFGMFLRDWFAGQALAGMCGHPRAMPRVGNKNLMEDARLMYRFADAMLIARAEGGDA